MNYSVFSLLQTILAENDFYFYFQTISNFVCGIAEEARYGKILVWDGCERQPETIDCVHRELKLA